MARQEDPQEVDVFLSFHSSSSSSSWAASWPTAYQRDKKDIFSDHCHHRHDSLFIVFTLLTINLIIIWVRRAHFSSTMEKRDGTSFEQTHKRKMCNILIYHNAMLMKLSSSKKKGLTKGRKDGEPKRGNNSVIQIPTKMKRRMHTVMPSSTRVSLWQKFKQIWEFDKLDNFSPTGSRFVYAVRDATWLHNLSLWIHFNILVIDSKSIITGSTRVHISCPFIECSKKKPFSKQWERLNAQQTRHHSCLWVFLTRRVVWQQKNEGDTWLSRH